MPLKIIIALVLLCSIAHAKERIELPENYEFETLQEGIYQEVDLERVIDGDTFVASGRKIRLWGIDAPEKNEPLYWSSSTLLKGILESETLSCKLIEKDRYQRYVMHCLSGSLDVGSMMVNMGMAKDYSRYSGNYYQYEQDQAKANKRGMWRE
uniref:Thermonuclease family protein n=1 Tax=Roseihalotalea indica TaxID=2867963 RepID=A0AA49JEK0_9BACT|nr:thermonuclease family protein [Tunicatimonas sp. TK19036]